MNNNCPNCETELSEDFKFCPSCGQPNHSHKVPIRHFLLDLLEGFFHFDTKLLVTLRDLFIPGKMTSQYNQNKRARYVPPIRLYIFISFFFFLLLSIRSEESSEDNFIVVNSENDTIIKGDITGKADTTGNYQLEALKTSDQKQQRVDGYLDLKSSVASSENHFIISGDATDESDTTGNYLLEALKTSDHPQQLADKYIDLKYANSSWLTKKIQRNILLFNAGKYDKAAFNHRIQKAVSYSMFLLMPVLALFLKLLYRRRKVFYSEHLIFSLHLHTLIFILLSLWLLFRLVNIPVGFITTLIILAYSLLFIKKVYNQGWMKSITKFLILTITYSLSIAIVIIFGLVISIIF
jgi:hypothetical protein